jgi:hypothetical protein
MMRNKSETKPEDTDKVDKTYEIYGDKKPVILPEIKKPVETPIIEQNTQQEEPEMEFIPNPEEVQQKNYYEDPNFDWSDDSKWAGDKYARRYYDMNIKPNI